MQNEEYYQYLNLARQEIALHNYPRAGELLEIVAQSGRCDPEFFKLLAMLFEAQGLPMTAKHFYRQTAMGKQNWTENSNTRNHL